ncbi:DNA-binding transcriptional LysR family regulator [Variovorax paradoxus]|jgi:DNA-binding transcriptional LysR family regulator|uniref:LysR family transcriptional regulator n=1 Tax=Variovorax paradoxus TaxID=34073 RepID=UPI0027907E6D|nr:LysR family transcriptional regulator [Variovorax paradoxus]MDQ0573290.1 DNA-binding transcriptional LysR family regulator [Variovorax paradoxus]
MSPELLPAIAAFARVAHHASFTRAAEELGVSPSALSQTMRTLERRLGVRLLDRTTRRVGVTELGQQLLKGAQPALAALAQAVEGIDEARDKPAGLLRLNVSRTSAELLLFPHMGDFAAAYPGITLELVCDNRLVELVEGGFDAGIRLGESLAQDVIAVPIGGPLRMVTCAAPRYLAGRKLPQTPDDLREHQCLNYRLTTGGLYRWEYAQDGRVLDIEVAGPLISNDGEVLLAAARDGAGIATTFEGSVRADLESGRLVPLLQPWWPTFPGFYLYHPSSAQIPRKLRVFIDFLQARHAPPPVSQRAVKLASLPRSRRPSPARRAK